MITIHKDVEVEVDVDMEDFDDDDLLEELERRGISVGTKSLELINEIYELRRTNKPYDVILDLLILESIGKII